MSGPDTITVRVTPGDLDALMVCLGVAAAHGVMDTALRLQELLESEREKYAVPPFEGE
jgi:hypothetical protein